MLKPTIKETGVNESERILEKIARETFLSLWSYPSLYRGVGGGKELIDLTIYFNNTLILFSDKGEVKFQSDRDIQIAWGRWYRSAIKESAKQLYAAETFIQRYPNRVFLNKSCDEHFHFDVSSKDLKIYLIAVTRGISKDAKRHFDSIAPGSSGTLSYYYPAPESLILQTPFMVNDLDPTKTFIHVLDDKGVELLLEELATPTDFINYLNFKECAIREHNLVSIGGEEDLLAYYLQESGEKGHDYIPYLIPDGKGKLKIPDSAWKHFSNSVPYALHYAKRKSAKGWNEILQRFSDSIISGSVGEGADLPILMHAKAVESLASENLTSRAMLSRFLFEKYNSVPKNVRSSVVVPSIMRPERVFVFVFFPWGNSYKDYSEYLSERSSCMKLYAHVARYKFPKAEEIVVFGAVSQGGVIDSESIIILDGKQPVTGAERLLAQKIMKEHKILDSVTEKRYSLGNQWKVGRNEECPCESGKKFKKCCGQP
ncbi:YecA family protein [Pseudomonas chlororaphis]|uniref:SEC-C domain-containing protein n=1 Tax=Pseudomonas chlororaphis subsp. aurantiaca TaxID=86192 RepID=A0AAJ0ZJ12_9PSED|nr:SEC-C metal-binding domain-containing protein [Pseudomonas chlororaphis]MBU4633461.1 SEC-C domain-containing protein [Pseudomonas chlororaphis subsp. aurantiaca]